MASALLLVLAGNALGTTIAQNSAWRITRPGATQTFRFVAYGDSIFAGYIDASTIARRAAPHATAEYTAALMGQNVDVRRRCQSGATASGILSRMNSDRSFMQDAATRIVMFEMCGNDYLQARSSFRSASGTCSYAGLQTAGSNCRSFTEQAMQNINTFAHANTRVKIVMNLYYPGFNADNSFSTCTDPVNGDPANGNRVHMRTLFLPLLLESNWWTCKLAEQYGFLCGDAFAEYMARDYDSNGDGIIDSDAIRYIKGESLESYKTRVLALAGTLRDSNTKLVTNSTTFDYLQSDDTHPTFEGATGNTFFGLSTPGGDVSVLFATGGAYPDGKNPHWNWNGHDRAGWGLNPTGTFTPPRCGNGARETVWLPSGTPREEPCDDGNTAAGDGCSSTCEIETGWACSGTPSMCAPVCGDALVVGNEQCDDGDATAGDGCSDTCTIEPGYSCMGNPSSCQTVCGDGLVVADEVCDDENLVDEDGCSSSCTVEDGWNCSGEPSTCAPICGDGLVRGTEECDDADGNGTLASCCTGGCTFQPAGTACDDGNLCTDDVCDGANQCTVTPRSCDDGEVCTDDSCNPASGCAHTPNGSPAFYNFTGFFAPVENPVVYNVGHAGRVYPIKFQLPSRCTDGYTRRLDAVRYNPVRYAELPCDSTIPSDPLETSDTSGASGLRYDAAAEQYIYNWQTSKTFAGKCFGLVLELDDGTSHYALFRFTK